MANGMNCAEAAGSAASGPMKSGQSAPSRASVSLADHKQAMADQTKITKPGQRPAPVGSKKRQ
jgi:hypothetical protein